MSPSTITLDEFVRELAAQRGMHRKVRLIARYWRQVQSLSSDERERVALALGSEAAWARLERLFAQDGTLSEGELAVKRALDSVGRSDPRELRNLAKKIRAGEYVEVGRDLTDVVGRALEEEAEEGTDLDTAHVGTENGQATEASETPEETRDDPRLEPAVDDDVAGEQEAFSEGDTAATPEPEPIEPPKLIEEPEAIGTAEPFEEPETTDTAGPFEEPELADEQETAEAQQWERRSTDVALSAAERLGVLRQLHDGTGFAEDLGREGRARLLERLGPGWAARRALSQLIRSRQLDGLEEALRLTNQIGSPIQEVWCLGDLVEHWDLDDAEIVRVLEAAPTAAARRRLQRRADRARR